VCSSDLDVAAKETIEYHIVGSAEANPSENKLSNESPVGKAIIGKKKGETVEVAAPRGSMKFKILEIKAPCRALPGGAPAARRLGARDRRSLAHPRGSRRRRAHARRAPRDRVARRRL